MGTHNHEEIEEEFNDIYTDEDILEVQEEYRRKRLKDSLIGPIGSTVFHLGLIIALAILITDKFKEDAAEIQVSMLSIEEVIIEEPPPIEEPIPEEIENTDVTESTLTTIAIENAENNDTALEDVSDDAPSTDDDSSVDNVSDIVVSPSAFTSPSVMGGRSAAGRAAGVSKFGGSKVGQDSLTKALLWLKKVQNPDGSWGNAQKEAMTSLAILTFLAHGDTSQSKNFGKTVKSGIMWLCSIAVENEGKAIGRKNEGGDGKAGRSVYSHGLVAYALSEATAMIGASQIEDAMKKAIAYVIQGQNPNGGYYYSYKTTGPTNLSNASFNYQALKAAYIAGSEAPGLYEAIQKAISHLKETCQETTWYYKSDNKNPRGPSMRAVGTLCLQLLGEPDSEEAQRIGAYIAKNDMQYLVWKGDEDFEGPNAFPLYSWYYGTQVMFQRGGNGWKKWNAKFQKLLLENQYDDGHWESPSDKESQRFDMAGIDHQVYSTTLCALMLTVYYRYLPTTSSLSQKKKTVASPEVTEEDEGLNLIE
jgi:hypothetical protein